MVGITLTSEQIRSAPPDVRHWIEQQVAALFAQPPGDAPHAVSQALAACSIEEARAILAQIQDLLPVVSVFFELGRETAGAVGPGVRALSLADIQRHTRLHSPEQVMQCVTVINQVLGGLRHDPQAMICAFDQQGHCFVADATSRAILALWHDIVASRALQPVGKADPDPIPVVESV
jgi:hypothetical protein